jgi:hypothetical protein
LETHAKELFEKKLEIANGRIEELKKILSLSESNGMGSGKGLFEVIDY